MKDLARKMAALMCVVTMLAMTVRADDAIEEQPAQEAPRAQRTPRPNNNNNGQITVQPSGGLILNFHDATIDAVLDELSAVAGFIVVKEVRPEGRVTLVSKQPVTADDAISLLNTVLKNAGYAAIQQGRILRIVDRDRARHANIPVRTGSDPSRIEPTDELITQVIPLRYADAMQLRDDLKPVINPDADFTANAASNALVITDTSANIRRIVEIVAALDTHLADAAEVKVFQLRYASASAAARLINDLFGEGATRGSRGQQQQDSRPPWIMGGTSGAPSTGRTSSSDPRSGSRDRDAQAGIRASVRVNASSDDRTNTLVVTGPPEVLAVIERVVKELDANPVEEESILIYRLKNAQALNIEQVVNMLFSGAVPMGRGAPTTGTRTGTGAGTWGTQGRTTTGTTRTGTTGGMGTFGQTGSRFGTPGQPTTAAQGSWLGAAAQLSQQAAQAASDLAGQVSVIADPDTNSLLVRTSPKNFERVKEILDELDRPVPQVLIKVLIAEVTHDKAIDLGVEMSILNLRASGLGQTAGTNFGISPDASGLVVQVLEQDFTSTIRALESMGKLDILSRPYILASDNQVATIMVGQRVPFPVNTRITETGQTISNIEYQDVGILLDVVPNINPEGLVILTVAPEISALTAASITITPGVESPILNKRAAQTRVGVMDGQTIVIGGLMEDRKTESVDKVPLLGDIPILGEAFKRRQSRKSKTELLIFLTPHVAATAEDMEEISRQEVEGAKLVPNAIERGAYDEHQAGMRRGTRPPAPEQAPDPVEEPKQE